MCTVSFIASKDKVFLTSNRDEHESRPKAFVPQSEVINGTNVIFPKDPKAGGTWFAINEYGTVVVLLNGAFTYHKSEGNYRKSRGLIVLETISAPNAIETIKIMDLDRIEPFTMVLYQDSELFEFRWDGKRKYLKQLANDMPYIWSSATLYSTEAMEARRQAFTSFVSNGKATSAGDIMGFHTNKTTDTDNGFIIDRKTGLKTFSVTQAVVGDTGISLKHRDLIKENSSLSHLKVRSKVFSAS